ncbi:hypothetical protein KL942_002192 [Ogataea angusta]|uniref:Topoisomerase I damage affected protein 11 n=1 Tax=Pichia angusta TaxID=870730 RepID=A0ABQ7RYY6_PICAN|nr:hypothetical protein KL942_002192 [Ogataea angusta]KAG7850149.1 hypothetical protein KL940_001709 [Ogataea angusta]
MSTNRSFKVSSQSPNSKIASTLKTRMTPDAIEGNKEQKIGTTPSSPYFGDNADGSPQSNKRTGINLGLSVFGTELSETKNCIELSSSKQETFEQGPVLPNITKNTTLRSPSATPTRYIEINQQDHGLSHDLRLLASKEMEILEINQQVKALSHRKKELENEIQELKIGIEKELTTKIGSGQSLGGNHGLFEKHVPKSPNSLQRRRLQTTGVSGDPLLNSKPSDKVDDDLRDDFGRSWFAKPLTLFQQIDSLIYQEFEKLHLGPSFMSSSCPDSERKNDELDISERLSCSSSLVKGNQENDTSPLRDAEQFQTDQEFHSSNDIVHSVSSKLWNFVNEVKQNLAVDEESKPLTPISSPKKLRTPSFSKRQSYGLHAKHRRRSSNLHDKSPGTKVIDPDCSDGDLPENIDTDGVDSKK